MAPSASKQKRLEAKLAKASKNASKAGSLKSTPAASTAGDTPAISANGSFADLSDAQAQMRKLNVATNRSANGVLVSDPKGRDIKIDQYTLSFHGRLLIEGAEISLNYGQRYGLLGENGSGKTTFLQSLAERDVEIPDHIDIYLVQGAAEPEEITAVEYIVRSAKEKVERLERLAEEMATADDVDELALELIYEELEEMDPSTFEAKAGAILSGLGFNKAMMAKPTKDMSGGWRMRVSLARALFIKPHLLLLDEPTSHLDLGAVVWLEAYLATYNHILILTSHSADFMDTVCTNMMDLTPKKKLVYYGGNYSTYLRTKADNEINQMKAYNKQQEEIAHIKKFIASAGTYANLVKQAKSKQKIIDKMEAAGLIEKVEQPRLLRFNFEEVKKLPPPIIAFSDVAFSYSGKKADYLYKGLNFGIDMDSRIAIVGDNGTGKSTLLNLITGDLNPVEGTVQRHGQLKLAKYSQHSADQLPFDKSPVDHIQSKFTEKFPDKDLQFWRQCVGRFGLSGAHQTNPINMLSDGLRNRVCFAEIALEHPHVILFDEPTNHLDMASIDSLATAIKEFEGGVVIVSHDFRLISQVAEDLWEVKDKQVINLTKEDISIVDYKRSLQKRSQAQIEKAQLLSKNATKGVA
jgi:ATP-binding cassette subfamily F protein 2